MTTDAAQRRPSPIALARDDCKQDANLERSHVAGFVAKAVVLICRIAGKSDLRFWTYYTAYLQQ
jgi:hypothetical protein